MKFPNCLELVFERINVVDPAPGDTQCDNVSLELTTTTISSPEHLSSVAPWSSSSSHGDPGMTLVTDTR